MKHCKAKGNPCRGIGVCQCECERCLEADQRASEPQDENPIEEYSDGEYNGL